MRIPIIIGIMFYTLACSPRNKEFNPFDDEFELHQTFRIEDYDTIIGECGYWNLTNRSNGGYYQFYFDEPGIVAKGFYYYTTLGQVDTSSVRNSEEFWKVVELHPIDLAELRKDLTTLGVKDVKYVERYEDVVIVPAGEERRELVNSLALVYRNDSIYFPSSIEYYLSENKVIRRIGYFNGRPY